MKIRDILKFKGSELITIGHQETLHKASRLLSEHNIGVLLVLDAKEKPVGIISERDIVREFARQGSACETTVIQKIMSEDLIIGVPDDDLDYVMNVMTQKRIRHLPILDEEQLAGFVSIGDVVKAQINQSETEIRFLRNYITGNR